ncbi:MAG: hypothetical protein DWQ47_03210 [Acidobacteria bacterium]|nr:MAG: hypothetical protein DWQ32_06760 [Acidobacteriota bacterium]REK01412.1 MAG: hypothetical protein DWQ38_03195 [Acidobacteriota bacterium]REK14368.1 MAG: hypothetical protein DWQ43_12450 [Acidobacteriota bacterium]REK45083.1 MAG: hypothetical protein DWQ47_03210 [Acidobacteriota bacterium]
MVKHIEAAEEGIKQSRDRLLRLHKVLMDWDRLRYETEHGMQSPGKFLELLLSEPRFEWLRVLSTLIVRIDESFDLDDGVSMEMLEGYRQEIRDIFDERSGEYTDFKEKFNLAVTRVNEAEGLREEILSKIDW